MDVYFARPIFAQVLSLAAGKTSIFPGIGQFVPYTEAYQVTSDVFVPFLGFFARSSPRAFHFPSPLSRSADFLCSFPFE